MDHWIYGVYYPIMRSIFVTALLLFALSETEAADARRFDFDGAERRADQALGRAAGAKPEGDAPHRPPKCARCLDTGLIRCPQHSLKPACVGESQPPADKCNLCDGLGAVVCRGCSNKDVAVQAEESLRRAKQDAAEEIAAINAQEAPDRLATSLAAYAARHFSVASSLDHATTLPCIHHGEGLIRKCDETFGAGMFSFTRPKDARLYLLNSQQEYERLVKVIWKERHPSAEVDFYARASGLQTYRLPSLISVCFEKLNRNQTNLKHESVHLLAHVLLGRVKGTRPYPVWIEEGFAAWSETIELGSPRFYCFIYAESAIDIMKNRDAALKQMAQQNKPVSMDRLSRMNYSDMQAAEYFQAWSLVTMLIERSPKQFVAFLGALPAGAADLAGTSILPSVQEKALQQSYGYDYPKLLAVWRQWVLSR
jgi:hypothetical protein